MPSRIAISAAMSISPYFQIARVDHWFKNVFMLPGIVLVMYFSRRLELDFSIRWPLVLLGIFATCLIASSNYVINEILDAPRDLEHPTKCLRPIPSGQVHIPFAWIEWAVLGAAGIGLAFLVNFPFGCYGTMLWVMGLLYNVPPIRLKDVAYGDVLSESINNPLRLALGWYATGFVMHNPPPSVLIAYWMFGAFLMGMKRFAEYRMINDPARAGAYRSSFRFYSEERLLESLFFYASLFGMMSGFFIARYRIELVLATPLVALAMAYYMHLGFKDNSSVQQPEKLFREKKLMLIVSLAFIVCCALMLVDIPNFEKFLNPEMSEFGPANQLHGDN